MLRVLFGLGRRKEEEGGRRKEEKEEGVVSRSEGRTEINAEGSIWLGK
jgi:hypothetical protein